MKKCMEWVGVAVVVGVLPLAVAAAGQKKEKESSASTAAPAPKGDPAAGKKLYKTHCAICHFDDATIVRVGPGMKGFFKLKTMPNRDLPVSDENVRKVIWEGSQDPQMPLMPAYRDVLSAKEMDDLLAYLKTL